MIWESTFLMTVIDLVIVAVAGIVAGAFVRHRDVVERAEIRVGGAIAVSGLGLLAGLHLFDLFTMWVLPGLTTSAQAMETMENLHLNWSWGVSLAAVSAIAGGLVLSARRLLVLVARAESLTAEKEAALLETKAAEADLRIEKKRLDRLMEASPTAIYTLSPEGDSRGGYVSANTVDVIGFTPEECVQDPDFWADRVHPEDLERVRSQRGVGLVNGGLHVAEYRFRHKDGSYRAIRDAQRLLFHEDGQPKEIAGYWVDVTQRRAREHELEEAKAAAQLANKLKDEFLANVSHEIRTPLNGVLGMTELTLDTELSEQQREYLRLAHQSGLTLLDTINTVLDFSKAEAGKVEPEEVPFALRDTLTGVLKPLAALAHEKGVEILYDEGPAVPAQLSGDPGLLRQVLVNIVGNAVKFTAEGEVQLTVKKVRDLDRGVELCFDVRDTGIGIPEDKLDHIFGSFQQADGSMTRMYGGTGLGLSIASEFAAMMGGDIRVESELGKGSSFHFTAPFRLGRQDGRDSTATDLEGVRVLVVDDNETCRDIVAGFARSLKMEVVTAASASAAFEILDATHAGGAPMAFALMDLDMPGQDGFQLAERIEQDGRFADLVMVALTPAGHPGDVTRCESVGISAYLLKPVTPFELADTIRLSLDRPQEEATDPPVITRHSLGDGPQSLRILLAEDNKVNQTLALHLIKRLGHTVELAENGREAVDLFSSMSFDLILMDIQMPELTGLEATAEIRELEASTGGHIPIIAMTAHAMSGDREQFLAGGMDEYISKPVSKDQLRDLVQTVARPGS